MKRQKYFFTYQALQRSIRTRKIKKKREGQKRHGEELL